MNKQMSSCIAPTRPLLNKRSDITVIIMASNIGYGMKSYGPKSLLNINAFETLIEYQINLIKTSFPYADIILVVGFEADRIIKDCPLGVRIIENQLFETTNEVEQVRLALNCTLTDNILIIKDDIVCSSEALLGITRDTSCLIYDSNNNISSFNIGITIVNKHVTTFAYDLDNKWCHIVYLAKKEHLILKNICNKRDRAKMYLHEALNLTIQRSGKIKAIEPTNMQITKIDNSRNLFRLQETL